VKEVTENCHTNINNKEENKFRCKIIEEMITVFWNVMPYNMVGRY
jgi:hypothetical protein